MKTKSTFQLLLAFAFFITSNLSGFAQEDESDNWSQWRGPLGTGVAVKGNPPTSFSETKNLKWKTPISGKGHATPIVWGNQIIVQTAVATNEKPEPVTNDSDSEGERRMSGTQTDLIHEYKVVSVNKENGKILWETTVSREMPLESTHDLGSWASNSPATDGKLIYAYFGSRGIYCLDFEGNIKWQRDFGQMEKHASFGEGSSPFLYKDKLFILWDHEGESFLYALDKNTGEDIWKLERDERTSWSSPFVVEIDGRTQVITSATTNIRSNDFETGELIWTSTGLTRNVIPNPIFKDGMLFVMSGFRGSALQAIDLAKAKGDITESGAIVWKYDENTPYTPNPVLMDGKIYFLRANNGYLTCLDAKDGKVNYSNQKLEGISTLFSSPTAVKDRFYIAAQDIVLVIKAGETFEVLESIELDDNFHSSPVIVGDDLILKGFNSLYCFSEE